MIIYEKTLFFVCDNVDNACRAAGKLRNKLGADLGLVKERDFAFCWVDNFPFFEPDENRGGAPMFTHNPFSYPMATLEELETRDPFTIKAAQFDMVLNGLEICSGGLRNYNPEVWATATVFVKVLRSLQINAVKIC